MSIYATYSDEELVKQYRDTGRATFVGALLERYTVLLLGVGMKYLKDKEEASDAVQQVFLKVLTVLPITDVQCFKGWLYVLMRNHCLQLLRERKRRWGEDVPAQVPAAETANITLLWEQELLLDKMQEALGGLEKGQRDCIRLFYLEKQSYQQIMEQKGYSFMQVKSHIQNGKRKLRLLLAEKRNNSK